MLFRHVYNMSRFLVYIIYTCSDKIYVFFEQIMCSYRVGLVGIVISAPMKFTCSSTKLSVIIVLDSAVISNLTDPTLLCNILQRNCNLVIGGISA